MSRECVQHSVNRDLLSVNRDLYRDLLFGASKILKVEVLCIGCSPS